MRAPAFVAPLLLVLAAGSAHAGLFDDDEARKAILDLRERIRLADEAGKQRQEAQGKQFGEELSALRRSLLDLNNQLESLRAEMARMRGANEQLARDVADLQRGQRDVSQSIDDRLRRIEPVKVSVDGREFVADPEEKKAYEAAIALLRAGDFDKAAQALQAFQRRFTVSGYTDSARFWLGNAFYGKRDYKEAMSAFRSFVAGAPDHPRAPEALLALANTQAELKDTRSARRTIDELLKAYPQSEAAQAGKERLASLK